MSGDHREFWARYQEGVEVAVASNSPEVLLGVRDGFRRFLQTSFERLVPVAIVTHAPVDLSAALPLSDDETLALVRARSARLEADLGRAHQFHVGAEGGLRRIEIDGESVYFVQYWAALRGLGSESWGSSGSLQIPRHLVEGLERDDVAAVLPATRRRGGLLSALSQGRESRRTAVSLAMFHALTTCFFGILGSRTRRR